MRVDLAEPDRIRGPWFRFVALIVVPITVFFGLGLQQVRKAADAVEVEERIAGLFPDADRGPSKTEEKVAQLVDKARELRASITAGADWSRPGER